MRLTLLAELLDVLVRLQPEVAGHLRCLAFGPGSAAVMLKQAVEIAGAKLHGIAVSVIELFVVGGQVT